jgi:hypothetical protein
MATSTEIFSETKSKNGWVLKINKNNNLFITTSLYDKSGLFRESKSYSLNNDNDLIFFKKYIELFEENPEKNLRAMLAMKIRV